MLADANAFLITAKHVDFTTEEQRHPFRDPGGYPIARIDKVTTACR